MSYIKRLERAFENAPILPITEDTQYVFFSDCHRGIGNNNDNFLKNADSYFAALQYYYQYGFCYIEAGDGDELWENYTLEQIMEIHEDIFRQLRHFHDSGRLYMLYGNHDMVKKDMKPIFPGMKYYESVILQSEQPMTSLYVTHGHQADFFNSSLWKVSRFLVRYLWTLLENFGFPDPTSAAKNNTKKDKIEQKFINFSKCTHCRFLAGHTHHPKLGDNNTRYYNCGSCIHPKCITCIELCGYQIRLVKWCSSTEKSERSPVFPVYIKREVLAEGRIL